jgi:hypothetical protein
MAVGLPAKTTYANGDVFSASDINDTNGTINLIGQTQNFYAGKNAIINGDFGVWQRGTSFTLTNGVSTYTGDRFVSFFAGTGSPTVTQQTFTPGTAPVAGYEGNFFMRYTCAAGSTYYDIGQRIEDVRKFANQTVTLSFWAKASSSTTVVPLLRQFFGSGGSANADIPGSNITISSSSWTRYTSTIVLPSLAGKTIGSGSYVLAALYYTSGAVASNVIDFWGIQLEAGSTATAFETATGTIQGELAACRYYYRRNVATGNAYGSVLGFSCIASGTTGATATWIEGPMRAIPTSIDFSTIALADTSGAFGITAVTFSGSNTLGIPTLIFTSSGLTQFRSYYVVGNNNAAGFLGISAEL